MHMMLQELSEGRANIKYQVNNKLWNKDKEHFQDQL